MVTVAYLAWPLAYVLMSIFVDPSLTRIAYNGQEYNVATIIQGCTMVGIFGMIYVGVNTLVPTSS